MTDGQAYYNPVKEDTDGKIAKRKIWSTQSMAAAWDGLRKGKKLESNPFYEGNMRLMKGDLNFTRTEEELEEYVRCMDDVVYFAEKWCKLMTPEGVRNIRLRPYQIKYLRHLQDNRLSIYLACRQCGKTTTSAIFMLWYVLFNADKNALVLGNKRKTAVEILDKAKRIFLELPFFLKPGIYKWNEGEVVLDNGCRFMCEATTVNSGIGYTFHCVLADEFAHLPANIMEPFFNNLFPTITAARARFMITSTQNGTNLFYQLYTAAAAGESDFAPFVTDWWEVPEWNPDKGCWEERDEAWHKRQIANYGGEEQFNRQFGTSFLTGGQTLISAKALSERMAEAETFTEASMPGLSLQEFWRWKEGADPYSFRDRQMFVTCDLAEGGGRDYTVFIVGAVVPAQRPVADVLGYFRSNTHSLEACANALGSLVETYMHPDRYRISVERNTYGELFYRICQRLMDEGLYAKWDSGSFIRYKKQNSDTREVGVRMTRETKARMCGSFRDEFETGLFKFPDRAFVAELMCFGDRAGNGTYEAISGHDDIVMAAAQVSLLRETPEWRYMVETAEELAKVDNRRLDSVGADLWNF